MPKNHFVSSKGSLLGKRKAWKMMANPGRIYDGELNKYVVEQECQSEFVLGSKMFPKN